MLKTLKVASAAGLTMLGLAVLFFALIEFTGDPVLAVDPQQPDAQRVSEIRAILNGVTQRVDLLEATVVDHTGRLIRLEETVQASKVVEPPDEPEVQTTQTVEPLQIPDVDPVVQSAGQRILSSYTGAPWYHQQSRGSKSRMIEHLVEHGMEREGLDRFSMGELEQIHGAIHTQHESATSYRASPTIRSQPTRNVQWSVRSQPVRIHYRSQNCPNGQCPVQYRRR